MKVIAQEETAIYKVLRSVRTVRLCDVTQSMKNGIYKAKDAYADDGVACLRMYNIGDGRILWKDIKRMSLSAQERGEYGLDPGDLLVNRVNSRELVGKTALITDGIERSVFESKNIRVRLDRSLVEPAYVNYALLATGRAHFNRNAQQVVGMASVSQPQVAAFEFTLRPIPQQREIVAYLDEQLSRLDASVAALHRVQANLKRYRASVLKAACEGRLVPTEAELVRQEGRDFETGAQLLQRVLVERRAQFNGKGKYKERSAPDAGHLAETPEGWTWSNVDQLSEVGTGATPKRDVAGFYEGGRIAWITSSAVNDEHVDRALEYVTERALAKTNLTIYPPGTLLLAMYGEGKTRGRCTELRIAATTNQALAAIQVVEPVRRYLRLLLERAYEETRKAASGGVQPNLNLSLVRAIAVPLPPLAEQHRIVAEADRRLSLIRVAEAQVAANLARAQRLRQSMLQAAFATKASAGQ